MQIICVASEKVGTSDLILPIWRELSFAEFPAKPLTINFPITIGEVEGAGVGVGVGEGVEIGVGLVGIEGVCAFAEGFEGEEGELGVGDGLGEGFEGVSELASTIHHS